MPRSRNLADRPNSKLSPEFGMDRPHRRRLAAGLIYKEFPARRDQFPALRHREFVAMTASRLENLGPDAARRVRLRRISLYLPCRSGISPKRRVRPRLPPPPTSPRLRRLRAGSASRRRTYRHFAGFWAGTLAQPNRRRGFPASDPATPADFLYSRFRRFAFDADSPSGTEGPMSGFSMRAACG